VTFRVYLKLTVAQWTVGTLHAALLKVCALAQTDWIGTGCYKVECVVDADSANVAAQAVQSVIRSTFPNAKIDDMECQRFDADAPSTAASLEDGGEAPPVEVVGSDASSGAAGQGT
jgi:hypothetical protein